MSSSDAFALSQREPARLTWLYIAALSAVAILSLLGQLVIQDFLVAQRSDSTVVNIAGRQRMLSQRIAKEAIVATHADSAVEKKQRLTNLENALAAWKQCHQGLQAGNEQLGLPGNNSAAVAERFAELNPDFDALFDAATALSVGRDVERSLAEVLRHEAVFLAKMDGIVKQYEHEAQGHVARLQLVERILFGLTIVVLILEGLIVFRPAVRHLQSTLTALQNNSRELELAKERAESASQAKSRLLANTSHELRTPLHAILGMSEQLSDTPLNDLQQRCLTIIEHSGDTLLQLVNDLLEVAAVDQRKAELKPTPIRLPELINDVVSILQASVGNKPIDVKADMEVDLPTLIVTDGLRLKQVLLNLGGNAIKFTPQGNITLQVKRVSKDIVRPFLRFAVIDTGIGIPVDKQASIFEPFNQVHKNNGSTSGGLGLGLAICQHWVQLLGGALQMRSEPGHGSEFSFSIPLEVTPDMLTTASRSLSPSALQGRRVLVVDDAPINREVAEIALRSAGCEVVTAQNGATALEAIDHEDFDVVLLDMRLPDRHGREIAAEIVSRIKLQSRPAPALLALTADGNSLNQPVTPFAAILLKPASREQIAEAIADVLEQERTDDALQRLGGDSALLSELNEIFRLEAPRLIVQIEQAIETGDTAVVHQASHRLLGQALQLGAQDIAACAQQLEQLALRESLSEGQEHLEALKQSYQKWSCESESFGE